MWESGTMTSYPERYWTWGGLPNAVPEQIEAKRASDDAPPSQVEWCQNDPVPASGSAYGDGGITL